VAEGKRQGANANFQGNAKGQTATPVNPQSAAFSAKSVVIRVRLCLLKFENDER
jgi:hypothetical protein